MSALVTPFASITSHPRISERSQVSRKFRVTPNNLNEFIDDLEAKPLEQRLGIVMQAHEDDHFLHRSIEDLRNDARGIEVLVIAIPRLLYTLPQQECMPVLQLENGFYKQRFFDRAADLSRPELMVDICVATGEKNFRALAKEGGVDLEMRLVHQMMEFKHRNEGVSSTDLLDHLLRDPRIKRHHMTRKPPTPTKHPPPESQRDAAHIHLVN